MYIHVYVNYIYIKQGFQSRSHKIYLSVGHFSSTCPIKQYVCFGLFFKDEPNYGFCVEQTSCILR